MQNDSYNFGDWNVPTSWDGITLKKFQEINKYYSDKDKQFDVREVIHIMTDKTIDEVNELPAEFLQIIMEKLSFLQVEPEQQEPSNKIEVNNEIYQINFMEKLKTGEYVSVDNILKADKNDYASILAILCRKEGEIYDSKFEAELFEQRKKMFEEQPITKILPIVGFFLNLYILLVTPSQLFSQVEEELNHIQKSIKTSTEIGVFRKHYLNWRMKKLKRLLRSNKNT